MLHAMHVRSFVVALVLFLISCAAPGLHNTQTMNNATPPPFEAMVVGTIHKFHMAQPEYPLGYIGAIVNHYKPDLLLVEVRPGPFAKGHFEDGPFEMTYAICEAKKLGIQVVPIDWFRLKDLERKEPQPDPDMAEAFQTEMKVIEANVPWPPTFKQGHSKKYTDAILNALEMQARYLDGNGAWNQRQAWFHEQAAKAIKQVQPKRVLALVGMQHRPELELRLQRMGGVVQNPADIPKEILENASQTAPAEVVKLWKDGIERMKQRALKGPEVLTKALQTKIRYFEKAVELRGGCCLAEE